MTGPAGESAPRRPRGDADQFSYEPFTRHPFYVQVNRRMVEGLVDHLRSPSENLSIVDLGCGTGAVTELLAEALHARRRSARILAIDPSPQALDQARQRLDRIGLPVRYVRGTGADLATLHERADAVVFLNAIHLVPDKLATLRELAAALAPGGLLAVNTTFFTGAYTPGTEGFYRLWTARALRRLRAEHPGLRPSREGRPPAMQWLSPDDYADLFDQAGLAVLDLRLDQAHMTLASFQDIGRYSLFIQGALPGVPLAAAADALHHGAAEAFAELHIPDVPRRWLQIVATRPESR